ncbi:MAG: hypothetical protein C5B60_09055 [Chloroflexi bacterium]|nr:MAG: hypothetical protein C5B60_09055 [Chloroflexota bacterium]
MGCLARFPTVAAWLVALVVTGVGTLAALQGLRALEPSAPSHLYHLHGIVVATGKGELFAVEESGTTKLIWFQVAKGAPISFAHVLRHLHSRAPTDVYYLPEKNGLPLAWIAD